MELCRIVSPLLTFVWTRARPDKITAAEVENVPCLILVNICRWRSVRYEPGKKIDQIQSPYKNFEGKLCIIEIKSMYLRPFTFEDFFSILNDKVRGKFWRFSVVRIVVE